MYFNDCDKNSPRVIVEKLPQFAYITSLMIQQAPAKLPQDQQQTHLDESVNPKSPPVLETNEELVIKKLWENDDNKENLQSLKLMDKYILTGLWKKNLLEKKLQHLSRAEDRATSYGELIRSVERNVKLALGKQEKEEAKATSQKGRYKVFCPLEVKNCSQQDLFYSTQNKEIVFKVDEKQQTNSFQNNNTYTCQIINRKRKEELYKMKLSISDYACFPSHCTGQCWQETDAWITVD